MKCFFAEGKRSDYRDLALRELERERVLLADLLHGPAAGPIELDDDDLSIVQPHLIHAVLIAVEAQQASVWTQANRGERVEHCFGCEGGVGMRHRGIVANSMPQNIVEIRDLQFAYDANVVLRGLSLDIPRGHVVAILGASGSGKSTLLKLIGAQLHPAKGSVRVMGRDIHALGPEDLYKLRLGMGMMFQNSGLFTDLSVFDNLAFPIRENFEAPDEAVRRLVLMKLNAVGLRGARDMMPADLSGGMTRRVALARAVATDPMLMMYDEPFAGLDPISLTHIVNLIRTLNEALGLTSIVVSYDVSEALKVADYAYMISDGAVLAKGTPEELRASPDPYLQQFLKAEPDGPVRFHVAGPTLEEDLGLNKAIPSG